MRRLGIIVLLLIVTAVPVMAFSPRDAFVDNVAAVAWLEGDVLNVAIGNPSNGRTTVTLSTATLDTRGRPVFSTRRVNVPGRSIVLETLYPSTPGRNQQWNLRISEGYRSANIPVQTSDVMKPESYIVQANTQWTVNVDLDFLMQDAGRTRIIVDDYYQTADGFNRDRIRIDSIGGGPSQVRGSNTIEYVKPYLVLKMKTPQNNNLTTMSFDIRKVDGASSWRDEVISGPIVLVYGRNIRYVGSAPSPSEPGRVRY